jgi:hypothetical protein
MKSESGPPHVTDFSSLLHNTRVKVTLIAMLLLKASCTSCVGANAAHSQAEHVLILEQSFASFAAVHEAFSNVYPDNKMLNKTTD